MDPPLRETMLVRGDIDAITGFSSRPAEPGGARRQDRGHRRAALPAHGVKLYGNVIIASPKFLKENPEAVKAFLRAFAKGAKEVMANPDPAIDYVKARDGIINVDLEKRRLRMAIDAVVASPDARAEGFGQVVPGAPGADGLAGVRRLRHQDRIDPDRRVDRRLPAVQGRAQHPAAVKK
jgi:NitT/TauT family transport system substrate-binding protein